MSVDMDEAYAAIEAQQIPSGDEALQLRDASLMDGENKGDSQETFAAQADFATQADFQSQDLMSEALESQAQTGSNLESAEEESSDDGVKPASSALILRADSDTDEDTAAVSNERGVKRQQKSPDEQGE